MTESESIPRVRARRHDWLSLPERKIPACESPDGNDRTEKTCGGCGIVKITVHGRNNLHWNKWRLLTGQEFQVNGTPPCDPRPKPVLAAETASEVIFR